MQSHPLRRETRPHRFSKREPSPPVGFPRPATVVSEHFANIVFTRMKSIASNSVVYDPGCTSHVCQPVFPCGFGRACAETNHGVAAALEETELCQLREEMVRFPPFNRDTACAAAAEHCGQPRPKAANAAAGTASQNQNVSH